MSNIVVPQLGESIVEARVVRWLKAEGDRIEVGEPIVELETEKIDLEVGAEHGGVLARIERRDGEDVRVGEILGVVDDAAPGDPASAAASPAETHPAGPSAPATPPGPVPVAGVATGAAAETGAPAVTATPPGTPRATPTARRIAGEHAVDLASVRGTGSAGRVTKQDVESFIAQPPTTGPDPTTDSPVASAAPVTTAGATAAQTGRREERVRMSKRRLTIARRLVEAQRTAAMLTTFNDVDMSEVMRIRERHKAAFKEKYGVGLGIASFFVKAAVAALKAFPQLNAEIQGEEIVFKHYYDIGVAVGVEGGLVVPVLRDTDQLSFSQVELAIRDFATRAGDGSLTLQDLTGGTFTVTNGGVFGSLMSTPILNPPQVGILGLHKIQDRAVPIDGQVVIRPMMYLALSYDHRIVDGREAVQFLVKIKEYVEDPGRLLLES